MHIIYICIGRAAKGTDTEYNIIDHRLYSILPTNRVIGLYDSDGHNDTLQGHFRREIL